MKEKKVDCDIAVVGAGICGSAVASMAAENGLRVVLVDRGDIGGGTSCATSKMLHGGIRYLANGEFKLIRECLSDREEVLKKLPFAAVRTRYVFRGTGYKRLVNSAAIGIYGIMNEFRDAIPHQSTWYEYTAHDSQIVYALARNASQRGCRVFTYSDLLGISVSGKVITALQINGFEVTPRYAIFCLGAWTDEVLGRLLPGWKPVLTLSRGVHLVADKRVYPHDYATAFETKRDKRFVMIIPFIDCVLIGTTDVPVDSPRNAAAGIENDVSYLIEETRRFMSCRLEPHIYGITCGVRPLVRSNSASTYEASREELILKPLDNCVVCVGGKLTNFLTISRKIVEAIGEVKIDSSKWITPSLETEMYFRISRHPAALLPEQAQYIFRNALCKFPSDMIFRRLPTKYSGRNSAETAKRLLDYVLPLCEDRDAALRKFHAESDAFYSLKFPGVFR